MPHFSNLPLLYIYSLFFFCFLFMFLFMLFFSSSPFLYNSLSFMDFRFWLT